MNKLAKGCVPDVPSLRDESNYTGMLILARLGRTRLQEEAKELRAHIDYLEDLLAHEKRRLAAVVEETAALKEAFAVPRRTVIVDSEEKAAGTTVMTGSDLVAPEKDQMLVLTPDGVGFFYRPSDGLTTRAARSVHLAHVRAGPDNRVILLTDRGRGWRGWKIASMSRVSRGERLIEDRDATVVNIVTLS